ncbi:DHA2 family efflux MFS transporter permease subunit [Brevibacillus borstelensis]|uniref:MDR family MFS transporter n=1 Tax=Brevibacillus borstelensis TaxID=45462 RepID=UPI0030BC1F77
MKNKNVTNMEEQQTQKPMKFMPIIVAIFMGNFLSLLNSNTINIALPVLQKEFASDLSVVQWTLTGFMLALGTFAPTSGYFGERFSYKRLYIFALLGMTVASVLCALSWNAPMLIAFRIVQGAFCGIIVPASMTMIFQIIPRHQQSAAMSIWIAASIVAPAIGPTYAGWLIQHGSWKWLFWTNVPLGLLAIVVAFFFIPYYRLKVPKGFDLWGLLTVIAASSLLLITLSQGSSWGWSSASTLLCLGGGLLALALFLWREMSIESPLLQLKVFLNRRFTSTVILLCIVMINFFSGMLLVPVFLQDVQGHSPLDTGMILLPSTLAMAIMSLVVGRLYKVVGPMPLLLVGVLLMAAGNLPLAWLQIDSSSAYTLLWMTVRSLGLALVLMPATTAGMEEISREYTGHASSIQNWLRNVFVSFGVALFTTLLASRTADHAARLTDGDGGPHLAQLSTTMGINDLNILSTLIVVLALPFVFAIRSKRKKERGTDGALSNPVR